MMAREHRILRQRVELVLRDVALARELQERLSQLQREKTSGLLDAICSELGQADRVEVIDELVVDLGVLDATNFEAEFLRELASGLRAALAQALEQLRRRSSPGEQRATIWAALLATFARAGVLPRGSEAKRPGLIDAALHELLRHEPETALELASSLLDEPIAARRLLRHGSDGVLAQLVRQLEPRWAPSAEVWVQEVKAWAEERAPELRGASALWHEVLWHEVFRSARAPGAGSDARVASRRRGVLPIAAWTRGVLEALIEEPARRELAWAELMVRLERVLGSEQRASERADGIWTVPDRPPPATRAVLDEALPVAASRGPSVAAADITEDDAAHGVAAHGVAASSRADVVPDAAAARQEHAMPDDSPALGAAPEPRGAGAPDRPPRPARRGVLPEAVLGAAGAERARRPLDAPRSPPARFAAELDSIAIDHSGLVLLWPFLRRLFERLQLLEKDGFRSRDSQQRAVAVLQHLASGELEPMEFDVPLAKILCGLPLFDLFELEAPIRAPEAEECSRLLQAVADHATEAAGPALPIERWQREFLTRPGLLTLRDGTWLLQVEREPNDDLLDRLPWTWAWVRLPWMEASLRVEW